MQGGGLPSRTFDRFILWNQWVPVLLTGRVLILFGLLVGFLKAKGL